MSRASFLDNNTMLPASPSSTSVAPTLPHVLIWNFWVILEYCWSTVLFLFPASWLAQLAWEACCLFFCTRITVSFAILPLILCIFHICVSACAEILFIPCWTCWNNQWSSVFLSLRSLIWISTFSCLNSAFFWVSLSLDEVFDDYTLIHYNFHPYFRNI